MKQLLFCIFLLSLSACHRGKEEEPAGVIPQEQMIQVLADMHVADAVVDNKTGAQMPNQPLTNALYIRIYKNRGITAEQFKTSYKYYEDHPEIMDNIYVQVITELSKREALLNKE